MNKEDNLGDLTGEGSKRKLKVSVDPWFESKVKPISVRTWSQIINRMKERIYKEIESLGMLSQASKDRLAEDAYSRCNSMFMFSNEFINELNKHENAIDILHASIPDKNISRNDIESKIDEMYQNKTSNMADMMIYIMSVNGLDLGYEIGKKKQ